MITNLRVIIKKAHQSKFSSKLDAVLSELGSFKIKKTTCEEYWKDKSRAEITYFFEKTEHPLSTWEALFEKTVGAYSIENDNRFTTIEHYCSLTDETEIFAILNIPNKLL